jgi:hypothetical protein
LIPNVYVRPDFFTGEIVQVLAIDLPTLITGFIQACAELNIPIRMKIAFQGYMSLILTVLLLSPCSLVSSNNIITVVPLHFRMSCSHFNIGIVLSSVKNEECMVEGMETILSGGRRLRQLHVTVVFYFIE